MTCQQLISAIKDTKNIAFSHLSSYGFSQGWKSLYNTVVYMKIVFYRRKKMRRSIRQLLTYFISCIYRFTCTAPCTPSCQNGGLCVARDVCKCPAEYMGEQCQYPLCRPPCINGGDCVRPNVCMCPAAWKGNRCQMPVCHLPCLNGGKYVFLSKKICNAHFQEHTGQT